MKTIHVSYGELVRSATEGIRGLGFPFGQADDAAEAFVWTQSVTGHGYDILKIADIRRPKDGWPRHTLSRDGHYIEIRLNGLPILPLALRVADLATSIARRVGEAHLALTDGFGGWIIHYIVWRLAERGLNTVGSWFAGSVESLEPSRQVVAAFGGNSGGDTTLFKLPLNSGSDVVLPHAQLAAHPLSLNNRLSISCGKPGFSVAIDRFFAEHFPGGRPLSNAPVQWKTLLPRQQLQEMIANGATVAAENHAHLISLCSRLRVPSSERSRRQAG